MKKLVLEVHVMEEQEALACQALNWQPVFREEFDYKGGGVWVSNGTYLPIYEQDKASIKSLQEFAEERLRELGITEFYTEIEEVEGWID